MSSVWTDDLYVVVKANGKLKTQRRKVQVWTTLKGAESNATSEGDAVHRLDVLTEPSFIRRKVL